MSTEVLVFTIKAESRESQLKWEKYTLLQTKAIFSNLTILALMGRFQQLLQCSSQC